MSTNMTFSVSSDGKDARLALVDSSGHEMFVTLSTDHVLAFISYLGAARATMIPQISKDTSEWLGSSSCGEPICEPTSFVVSSLTDGNRILVMRHPGYGWLGFQLTQPHADSLATMLTISADNPLSKTEGNA